MDVQVSVAAGGDDSTLASLYRWLAQDEDVGNDIQLSLAPATGRPGEMSATVELINAIVSNSIALGSLVVALVSWRQSRATAPIIRVQRKELSVTIDDGSPEAVQRAIDVLSATVSDPEEDGK